jgi:hypothetical protein
MTEDLVIKAIQDLSNAIKGGKNLGGNTQIEAITRLTNVLRPGNKLPLHAHSPRVQFDAPPRVQFNTEANQELPFDAGLPPQLIAESSTASTQQQQPQPMPILRQPTIFSSESVANRVKKRRGTPSSSIVERIVQQ